MPDQNDPLAQEITRALQSAQIASPFTAPLIPVQPTPYQPGGYQDTNLMQPGQDPAMFDLGNPPQVGPAMPAGQGQPPVQSSPDYHVPFDAFGQVQPGPEPGYPDGAQPEDPYAQPPSRGGPVNPYAAPAIPGNLPQALKDEQSALGEAGRAQETAATAQVRAAKALADRQADVYDQSAKDLADINATAQRTRDAAHRAADAETATWIQQVTDLGNKEPDPSRWWENTSGFGKALWLLSLAFGAKAQAAGARSNVAFDMIQHEIAQDIQTQKDRLAKQMDALRTKGGLMKEKQARVLSDLRDDQTMALGRIQALEKAHLARAQAPSTPDEIAAQAQAQAGFAQLKLGVMGQYREMRFQEKESAAQRAHAAALQATQLAQQKLEHEQDLDYKYWSTMANNEVELAKSKGAQGKLPETRGAALDTGMVLVGDNGKPIGDGTVKFRSDEVHGKATGTAVAGTELYSQLGDLADLVEKQPTWSLLGGIGAGELDPNIARLVSKIAYTSARESDPGGRLSDIDVLKGGVQKFGFSPDGKIIDRAKFATHRDEIVKMLREEQKNLSAEMSKKLAQFNDTEVNGQHTKIIFSPQKVKAPDVPQYNSIEEQRRVGYDVIPMTPIKSAKDYNKALEKESDPSQRGAYLQPHDTAAVKAAQDSFFGRSPDVIRLKAKEALDRLDKAMPPDAINDPWATFGSPEERQAAIEKRRELQATERYIKVVADDAAKQAEKTLKQLEGSLEKFRAHRQAYGLPDLTLDDVRSIAKSKKMMDAEPEIEALYKRVMNEPIRKAYE